MQQGGWYSSNDSNSSLELNLMNRVPHPASCGAKHLKGLKESWMTSPHLHPCPRAYATPKTLLGTLKKEPPSLAGPARSQ